MGFGVSGFRVQGLEFRGLRFGVPGFRAGFPWGFLGLSGVLRGCSRWVWKLLLRTLRGVGGRG